MVAYNDTRNSLIETNDLNINHEGKYLNLLIEKNLETREGTQERHTATKKQTASCGQIICEEVPSKCQKNP